MGSTVQDPARAGHGDSSRPGSKTIVFGACATALALALATPARAGVTWLQKLVASDGQPDDQFGRAVALGDGVLAISAPLDDDGAPQSGSIYVFEPTAPGWTTAQKLMVSDAAPNQLLGLAGLAADGDWLLAGASGDGQAALQAGAAYLFQNTGASWQEHTKLIASDAAPFDGFGWSVAVDGETAVVSAYLDDEMYTDAGAVYVFRLGPNGWVEQTKLTASDAFASDQFGYRVDLLGNRIAVGAPWDDDRGSRSGSVYIFERPNLAGNWVETAKLAPADLGPGDQFGHDVSLSGPRLAVGAAFTDTALQDIGAAYVLVKQGGNWAVQARLFASDPEPFDAFGSHVALDGRSLLVTSELDDNEQGADAGSATLFLLCAGTWRQEEVLEAPDGNPDDLYAAEVDLSDGFAILGASRDDEPEGDEGSAYVYRAAPPTGQSYCFGAPNSTGEGASICAVGSPVVADQDLTIIALNLPAGVPGLMFFGPGQVQSPFGNGTRCVGNGPSYRVWPFVHADATGKVNRPINWSAAYASFLVPGATMNFQIWYRDLAAGGAGFNLTNGVSVALE